ncbi:zf-HC2 domain-containing protein [Methylococcus sp. EFPC2]|uniref:zf-HC2 domain-containing protein n=1 Tax=Methylococcus sp. EFPC2 TaxID=2812648 RepID=UPI0019684BAB|nr:zf-HC2 domain-containing protein [Methylococcus sp. EFPC2]QSA98909.1 zf-HC2 domain-containing protein [Methylococcus sp. EFPC2]
MMNCRETSLLLSRRLDTPLSLRERIALRLHLMMCDGCRSFAAQMRWLHRATAELETRILGNASLKLSEPARTRIARALRDGRH